MTGTPHKIPLWIPLVALLAATVGYGLYHDFSETQRQAVKTANAIGGPFTLVDQNGRTVTDRDFRGKFMLIHFGYTYSPNVAPTALSAMAGAVGLLGAAGNDVVPLFISVDPKRDTPDQLKMYVRYFPPRLIGLTGTPAQIAAVAKAYHVYYATPDNPGPAAEDYPIDYTPIIYLMGRKGEFRAHFSYDTPATAIAARIREYR